MFTCPCWKTGITTHDEGDELMYDIIISGYYGFDNSGDDAILMAIIDNLRSLRQDLRIVILSKNPEKTRSAYGVDAVDRFNLFEVLRVMKNAKLFINGGGTLITDITSTRSLMYYLATIHLARKKGLKVMLYANGIGPVRGKLNRMLTSRVINQVDVITLREEASRKELDSLDITRPEIAVTADPALWLQPSPPEEIRSLWEQESITSELPMVGFCIRKWEGYDKYSNTIAGLADYMVRTFGVKPVFIPMHFPGDLDVALDIASKMTEKAAVMKNRYSVAQTLGMINQMEMVLGMRLHALIYAVSLQVPVIGLIYDPKVEGFLQYVNQPSAGHVKVLELETVKKLSAEIWEKRSQIKAQLALQNVQLKEKAYHNARIAIRLLDNQ